MGADEMTVLIAVSLPQLVRGVGALRRRVGAAVGDVQVVLPGARCPGKLSMALERLLAEGSGEALVEAGSVAPVPPHAVIQGGAIGAAHATRVEVLHHQSVAV